jgi:hypothetical protein
MSGQRRALIVASDEYEQDGLSNLAAPAADAAALAGVLGDPEIGDFDVQVIHNEPAHVVQAQIEDLFSESRPDDVLLLHFSCHGLKSDSGELFFAATNTRPNRLGSTAVSADFVQRCMRSSRSRTIVLLLDCCYGGAFAQGVAVRAAADVNVLDSFPVDRSGGRGRAVITASTAMEYAFEGEQLNDDQPRRPSLFTAALTEGLATGDADRDEDGWISLNELYEYVFDAVRGQNPHQTPSRQVDMQGELYLARSQRRRIQAAPLPADLQSAMTDPNMYTRLGAVSELQVRLGGSNLAAAAGAYTALTGLLNDIRYVAEPAAAALGAAALHPEPGQLHFGPVEQGVPVPAQRVRLPGPPVTRACTLRPSHDWIRCDLTADGFDVFADTTHPGQFEGTIEVKGPTGRATVSVSLDVAAPAPGPPPEPEAEPGPAPVADLEPVPGPLPASPLAAVTEPDSAFRASRRTGSLAASRGQVRQWWHGPGRHGPDRPVPRAGGAVILAALLCLEAAHFPEVDAVQYPEVNSAYWWTVFAIAVAGLVLSAFELPPRWPTTGIHLLNSVFFLVLPLVLLHLRADNYDPGSDNPSALLAGTLLIGTAAYLVAAIGSAITVMRGPGDLASLLGLASTVLMVTGALFILVTAYQNPVYLSPAGCYLLFAAALVSVAAAVVLLFIHRRPETTARR